MTLANVRCRISGQQLAIQQQLESINQQQQQLTYTYQQYASMGMLPPQQHLSPASAFNPVLQGQMAGQMQGLNPFHFPQQQPQLALAMNAPIHTSTHRRNQSALPNMGMGPPPAPSSGASGSAFGDFGQASMSGPIRESGGSQRGGRGGHNGSTGGGHARRHSLALPEAKKAAELEKQKRTTSGFQFPIPGAAGAAPAGVQSETSPSGEEASTSEAPTSANAAQASLQIRSGNRGGHGRSQSMAVGTNGRVPGHGRGASGFQFPQVSSEAGVSTQSTGPERRGSQGTQGVQHARNSSRNFEGNWRQASQGQTSGLEQQSPTGQYSQGGSVPNPTAGSFQPGHRPRGSMGGQSIGSLGAFQYAGQPQIIQLPTGQMILQQAQPPQAFAGQLSPIQIQQMQIQAAQQMAGLQGSQHAPQQMQVQQSQAQQRKTLFTPYLPQANLPALLSDGQLVAGVLRVNKKNRSDAYVTTQDGLLDADIFICGSKDRNRALEGDLVAVELLDVDEVWGQKREKEEKKKRKDITDTRGGSTHDKTTNGDDRQTTNADGGLRRRGSLRQRPTQKKNDDVEVEGQSLLLVEEEEVNDEQKPLYAGHVVAVIERVAGQMFSGTLGLLRPSSQATKEKQEAERQAREGSSGRHQPDRPQDKPKIVWFKPTDKRVPLIAIPTEQAPRDFIEKHQDYANRIFVACIKRWPITSLHPFGTLVEQLGEMGNLKVETDALLRDNNFAADEFSDAVIRSVGFDDWSVEKEDEAVLAARRDFRAEKTFTIDPNGAEDLDDALHVKTGSDGLVEIGIHIADVANFIKTNSLVDREAKKRGTGVFLVNRTVNMLPAKLSSEVCSLSPGQDRFTVSVVFKVNPVSGQISDEPTWIGKGIIRSTCKLSYKEVDAILLGQPATALEGVPAADIKMLHVGDDRYCRNRLPLTLHSRSPRSFAG